MTASLPHPDESKHPRHAFKISRLAGMSDQRPNVRRKGTPFFCVLLHDHVEDVGQRCVRLLWSTAYRVAACDRRHVGDKCAIVIRPDTTV